jgi:hypothetical protein
MTTEPFDLQNRGILSAVVLAKPPTLYKRIKRKHIPFIHVTYKYDKKLTEDTFTLTVAGWHHYRNQIQKAFNKNQKSNVSPACNSTFKVYEEKMLELLTDLDNTRRRPTQYPEDHGLKFPILVLTCTPPKDIKYTIKGNWIQLNHQTGGVCCHQHEFFARVLSQTETAKVLAKVLNERFDDSCITEPPTLSTALEYSEILKSFKLSCERNVFKLEEALYPIDIEHLPLLSKTRLPKNLSDLITLEEPKTNRERAFSALYKHWFRFELYLLTENSD